MTDDFKSDLRSTAQGYKRAAAQKAKWAHGIHNPRGRNAEHPRPKRVSDFAHPSQRNGGSAFKAATVKKQDMMHAAHVEYPSIVRKLPSLNSSDDSASSADEELDDAVLDGLEGDIVHGATVDRAPASGSQVLNSALARAIEAFEDKETVRLVRNEWSVVNDDGEEVGFSPVKKARGKKDKSAMLDGEDEYELV